MGVVGRDRERDLLQRLPTGRVKDAKPRIFGAGGDDDVRGSDNWAAKVSDAGLLARDHCAEGLLPDFGQGIEIDSRDAPPGHWRAAEASAVDKGMAFNQIR